MKSEALPAQPHSISLFDAIFSPRAVALVGVSSDASRNTARPLRFMRKHGYAGQVFPVNATRAEVLGEKAWPSIAAIAADATPDAPVDHVFVMIGAAQVEDALVQSATLGARVVTVFSDGFGETGEAGQQLQDRLVARARELGLRLIGPNSIGTVNVHNGALISVNAVFEMEHLVRGPIAMVSQSGSMLGSLLSRGAARGFGFGKLLSVGNESDVTVGEVVDGLVDDTETQVITLFLETLRDAKVLGAALDRARLARKPVIAYKLGRSEMGSALAQSHTGALAGNDAAVDAFFRAHGVLRVEMLETLFEMAPLATRYADVPCITGRKPRLAVITTTGGGAASVVDRLGQRDIEAVAPPADFIAHMAARGLKIRSQPVIDLTLAATSAQYRDLVEQMLQSDWCDGVLSVVGSSAQFHPGLAVKPLLEADKPAGKPLAVFLAPDAPQSLRLLQEAGIAAFRTPEGCADALATFFSRRAPQRGTPLVAPVWPQEVPRAGALNEMEASRVFDSLGIRMAQAHLLEGDRLDHGLPYPLVLKVCSRDIAHKTEVGGVSVGIRDDASLREQVQTMRDRIAGKSPDAAVQGYLVQRMEKGLVELMLGFRHDPLVGPIVVLGAGGITAELTPDVSVSMAPVHRERAVEMIDEVRATQLVRGFRGLPQGDCDALADAIVAFSTLSLHRTPHIAEAEINPLFVKPTGDGVVGVDGLIVLG
ncbi:acetate--CoA ligase family protein [Hydrogenophaga palleronii]|uniref:acetate--CoA ligase family protein n=1 Tax=Hydrogenophaga palleronii TaxID=65655 RepID=UPI00082404D7|nr:acetate--CoA ligase family protein [Hydrogenophaga palleronii]